MSRVGFVSALLALLLVVVVAGKSESNSTSPPNVPTSSGQSVTVTTPESGSNKTKDGVGQGYGHRRHEEYGRKKHHGGHRRNHNDDYDAFPYSKPYFDTHYCSVHGSFRLSYNEKSEKKEYGGNNGYQQQEGGYGNSIGSYGNNGGSYGNNGGSYGNNGGSYGKKEGGYERKPHYVRKITRQYCRYAAAWSEKACKFCCKVVARSAYTNPDDIIAAIFSFDPANPSSGGYGVESYGKHHEDKDYDNSDEYDDNSYGKREEGYGKREEGYGNRGGYENQGGYGNQQGYGNQGNYNQGGGQSYGQQPYAAPQYRAKRQSGYSQAPAPAYGSAAPAQSYDQYQQPATQYQAPDQYQAPAADQYQAPASDQYSATPDAYSTKPDHGNKYENSANAINQCVCCAPKHRYY